MTATEPAAYTKGSVWNPVGMDKLSEAIDEAIERNIVEAFKEYLLGGDEKQGEKAIVFFEDGVIGLGVDVGDWKTIEIKETLEKAIEHYLECIFDDESDLEEAESLRTSLAALENAAAKIRERLNEIAERK